MELNICYVVGTALLYMNKLSLEDLEKICNKLSDKGYVVDVSIENIFAMLNEWRDFFKFDLDNNILPTKKNKHFLELIFNSVLDSNTNSNILNSILYRNKQEAKIIKFQ